ncbi:MAG: DoxX family membrane protein [Candidatus Dadabacteria bacterium]|nr:DoxX family membrane protein [Candidatus Dadabacteria bacterium]NIQ15305.1 DoxX family membrane protein [Candidatus Dadabacteria bacterium]
MPLLITKNKDLGLLILRIGVGLSMMIFHGFGKLKGGPELWEKIGGNMSNLGIDFFPVFWGFMAAFSEFFASFFIIVGFFFKPATALLIFTMFVAILRHLSLPDGSSGAGWSGASHALELLVVYLALFFTGPGKYKIY